MYSVCCVFVNADMFSLSNIITFVLCKNVKWQRGVMSMRNARLLLPLHFSTSCIILHHDLLSLYHDAR